MTKMDNIVSHINDLKEEYKVNIFVDAEIIDKDQPLFILKK